MGIFFSSDYHFNHNKDFIYKARGFECVEDMNEEIIRAHNEIVREQDDVYLLGDLMLMDDKKGMEYLSRLNGRLHIIIGNHDTDKRLSLYSTLNNVEEIEYAQRLQFSKFTFFLSHYPLLCFNFGKRNNTINLCGHLHTTNEWEQWNEFGIYHIDFDAHGRPVSIEEIVEKIERKIKEGNFPPSLS